jgi:hypothetical protein
MNIRSWITIALLLPVVASAQRRAGTRINGGRPRPAPLPEPAPVVAREMSYVPRPYSLESYTFISYVQAPNTAPAAITNYGTLGAGTHLDYRLNPSFSITSDLTTSVFGGPAITASWEVGTRFRPISALIDVRAHPYVDLRLGYAYSYESYYITDPAAVLPRTISRLRAGGGIGAIGGVGSDYSLTESLALTTGIWASRTRLHSGTGIAFLPASSFQAYWLTTYRMMFGLKWNPMYLVPTQR